MGARIKAWWWIARHPIKSAAIRRYVTEAAPGQERRGSDDLANAWDEGYAACADKYEHPEIPYRPNVV